MKGKVSISVARELIINVYRTKKLFVNAMMRLGMQKSNAEVLYEKAKKIK